MGQDTTCGICSKHYQACRHYIKSHISVHGGRNSAVLCGQLGDVLHLGPNWEKYDTDPEDVCQKCWKIYEAKKKQK